MAYMDIMNSPRLEAYKDYMESKKYGFTSDLDRKIKTNLELTATLGPNGMGVPYVGYEEEMEMLRIKREVKGGDTKTVRQLYTEACHNLRYESWTFEEERSYPMKSCDISGICTGALCPHFYECYG